MGAPERFHFDEASHTYTLDGLRLPSVTEIIRPISEAYANVPTDVLERKRALGQAVHLACELDDDGELDEAETDAEVMGYVNAWRKFRRENEVEVLENERQLYHPTLRYAGTLDRLLRIRAFSRTERFLGDIKTAIEPYPAYGVQLAGYDMLRQGNGEDPVGGRVSIHLFADGRYRLRQYRDPNDYAVFRALLSVWHWKEGHK